VPLDPARGDGGVVPADALRRPMARARLLLVEDVQSNRELAAALLRREGHRVDLAENGFAAVELAARQPYDAVLMDIHMPGIDGVEAARRIRALPGPAGRVPIIALTGTSSTEERMLRVQGAMDAVLMKPVRAEDLFATLRRFTDPCVAPRQSGAPGRDLAVTEALDVARIEALRDGLAPGVFSRLLEQCLADMDERLPGLAAAADGGPGALREAAHALAGMAGSYGLVAFERQMRAVMRASDAGDVAAAAQLAAAAAPAFSEGKVALLAFLRAA
jgi:CheY-like chemotaxis protein